MAVLSVNNPTLLDLQKSKDPDGKIARVVEILTQTNEILQDMSWVEGNLPTGHQTTIRSGIPTPTWRKMNEGVQPQKSTKVQVIANTGQLAGYSEVDADLARQSGDVAEYRTQEDIAQMEGMNQEIATKLIFGNEGTEAEAFTGFAPFFNDKSAENGDNIIDAAGTGTDNRSIYLVVWAPETAYGIIPKGSEAGLRMQDNGEVTIQDVAGTTGTRMQVFQTYYTWKAGLVVADWRYVVRIANIDKSDLSVTYNAGVFASPSAHLPNLMFEAIRRIPTLAKGRPAFYMSRDMLTTLFQQAQAATQGSTLKAENVGGRIEETFMGIPLRRLDVLAADEARVT